MKHWKKTHRQRRRICGRKWERLYQQEKRATDRAFRRIQTARAAVARVQNYMDRVKAECEAAGQPLPYWHPDAPAPPDPPKWTEGLRWHHDRSTALVPFDEAKVVRQ